MFWPNLDKFSHRVMRYDLFVDKMYISRISDLYKKSFIFMLLKYCYIFHSNNLFLISDLFVRSMMTYL